MFGRGHVWALLFAFAAVALALSTARPSQGASPEEQHVVRVGETLWWIASSRYAGDPRTAIWRIEQRNGLTGRPLQPGTVLYLPQ